MGLLQQAEATLPASWYIDESHYQRELQAIWYREWVCIGRCEELPESGDYRVVGLGSQSLIVTRDATDQIRIYHNTCRHRGSMLCASDSGHFNNHRIVCPYHSWSYATSGELLATPGNLSSNEFPVGELGLYEVNSGTWGGFIFVSLADQPRKTLSEYLGKEAELLRNWPLEELRVVRSQSFELQCNWKIFWENYSECYHCPRVHPELCQVMPVYGKAVFDDVDLPGWQPAFEGDTGVGRVGNGAATWTMDGKIRMPLIDGLSDEDMSSGVIFSSFTASLYVVGHADHVRSVRVKPAGPESTELIVEWLVPADGLERSVEDLDHMVELGQLVVAQDGDVCELNQRGLHSIRHDSGVLVAQEYELMYFHKWVRARLAEI